MKEGSAGRGSTGRRIAERDSPTMATKSRVVWHLAGILFIALVSSASAGVFADSPFDPVTDDPKLPRVLLIGDSISIGYTIPVRQLLKDKANVHRIPVNGQDSGYGLAHIKEWLGDGKWDVIYCNWGIWDTHLLDGSGGIIDEEKGIEGGKIRTAIPEYQENLSKLIDIMESTGAKLIWATSTPVMCRKGTRLAAIGKYNKAAVDVMNLKHVTVDDLYTLIKPHLSELQSDDGVHYTPQGYNYLGKRVAECVLAALSKQGVAGADGCRHDDGVVRISSEEQFSPERTRYHALPIASSTHSGWKPSANERGVRISPTMRNAR